MRIKAKHLQIKNLPATIQTSTHIALTTTTLICEHSRWFENFKI